MSEVRITSFEIEANPKGPNNDRDTMLLLYTINDMRAICKSIQYTLDATTFPTIHQDCPIMPVQSYLSYLLLNFATRSLFW